MKKKKPKMSNNLVAKYCELFNKPRTHKDKTKYNRKTKHKGYDDSLKVLH